MEPTEKSKILHQIAANDFLPSLSPLTIQLIEAAADEQSSVLDLTRIIEQDPGLTTRLLKLVNSAYFARRSRISSVSHAIIMAGFKKVRLMALNISLRDTFPLGRVGGMDYDLFWKTSLYRALIAQGFAQASPLSQEIDPEEVFTAGLILEIGMLLLFHICTPPLKEGFPGRNVSLEDTISWEKEHLGVDHREAGRLVLHRWHFPEQIIESQKFFGSEALQEGRSILVKILEFARISTQFFFTTADDFQSLEASAPILGLPLEKVNEILVETFSRVEEVASQLRLMINTNDDLLRVMDKANRTLSKINGNLETSFVKVFNLISDLEQTPAQVSQEDREEKNKLLENAMEAVAHEIRNPLMAIGGFAHRLAKNVEQRGDVIEYVHLITKESLRLEKVLKDLVAYSQAYEPFIVTRNITHILDKVLEAFQTYLDKKRIQVVRLYKSDPLLVPLDDAEISKAFHCLLETVIYLLEGYDQAVWINLEGVLDHQEVRITIRTRAGQFPEEIQSFLRSKDFASKSFGQGLGLSLARKIINAHGGRLESAIDNEFQNLIVVLPAVKT
ncbi:MAG: HDOD domain-containing protein [Deltaproteobacteria bacterium]|nr:HDOD domain-containing protein [Deltaproteobacteria bacterium]